MLCDIWYNAILYLQFSPSVNIHWILQLFLQGSTSGPLLQQLFLHVINLLPSNIVTQRKHHDLCEQTSLQYINSPVQWDSGDHPIIFSAQFSPPPIFLTIVEITQAKQTHHLEACHNLMLFSDITFCFLPKSGGKISPSIQGSHSEDQYAEQYNGLSQRIFCLYYQKLEFPCSKRKTVKTSKYYLRLAVRWVASDDKIAINYLDVIFIPWHLLSRGSKHNVPKAT